MISDHFLPGPGTILVSGATGLIGRALVERLRAHGHTVRRLVRPSSDPLADDRSWDPARGRLDPSALDGVTAVVHLAGEPVAHRWTAARKAAIRDSRVQGTTLLARAIAAVEGPKPCC